jgi:hypothetical protein
LTVLFLANFPQRAKALENETNYNKDKVIAVYGVAINDYSQVSITGVFVTSAQMACNEEITSNPVFRIVSVGKDGKILQARRFDMVTVDKGKSGGLTGSKTISSLERKEFCIRLKAWSGAERVQLFRGKKLLVDAEIKQK